MKISALFFFLLISHYCFSQTYELLGKDTVNYSDINGIKSGKWIYYSSDKKTVVTEGFFKNGLKDGVWKEYSAKGTLKNEITWSQGKKQGHAKSYYENGNLKESGFWDTNKWTGEYLYFHENGNPFYLWSYNENGERTGKQQYFHSNGKINIEGSWQNGKENGTVKEYDQTGKLIAENVFQNGIFDPQKSKTYTQPEKLTNQNTIVQEKNVISEDKNSVTNTEIFSGNGYHKFYNSAKQIEREGNFKNGYLIDGKHYIYDTSGKLIKINFYESGKISDTQTF